jgi:hypothetical protein
MPPPPSRAKDEAEETIVEFVVRERLNRDQLLELLTAMGGQKQGSRDELAERLLGIRGLKPKDVLQKLSTDDLKLVAKRFDVPEAGRANTPSGFFNSLLTDERSSILKRTEDAASRERAPRPITTQRSTSGAAARTGVPGSDTLPAEAEDHRGTASQSELLKPSRSSVSGPSMAEPARLTVRPSPAPALVGPGEPADFDDLCKFLESYTFTKRWDEEIQYEAELGGAISGRFRGQKVTHQMAVGGTKADIVACGGVIEIKFPKTRQPLQTLSGQVDDYQKLFGNRVIVVLCSGGLRETAALSDTAATLKDRGVQVFIK